MNHFTTARLAAIGCTVLASALVACGGAAPQPGTPAAKPAAATPATAPTTAAQPSPTSGSTVRPTTPAQSSPHPTGAAGGSFPGVEPAAVDAVRAAIREAAKVASVAEATVRIEGVEPVQWRSGALGCPEPGMLYTQALVPGYRVRLSVGGQIVSYNTDATGRRAVTCQSPTE